jgi:hypothetical protein
MPKVKPGLSSVVLLTQEDAFLTTIVLLTTVVDAGGWRRRVKFPNFNRLITPAGALAVLPLPKGEGRGEGEGIARQPTRGRCTAGALICRLPSPAQNFLARPYDCAIVPRILGNWILNEMDNHGT